MNAQLGTPAAVLSQAQWPDTTKQQRIWMSRHHVEAKGSVEVKVKLKTGSRELGFEC